MERKILRKCCRWILTLTVLLLCRNATFATTKEEAADLMKNNFKYEYEAKEGRFILKLPAFFRPYSGYFAYWAAHTNSDLDVYVDGVKYNLITHLRSWSEDNDPEHICWILTGPGTFRSFSTGKVLPKNERDDVWRDYDKKGELQYLHFYWYPPIDFMGKTLVFEWNARFVVSKNYDTENPNSYGSMKATPFVMPSWPFDRGAECSVSNNEKPSNTVDTRYYRSQNDNCTTDTVFQRYVTYANGSKLDDFVNKGGKLSIDGKPYTPGDKVFSYYTYALDGDSREASKTVTGSSWKVSAEYRGTKDDYTVTPSFTAWGIPGINWLELENGDGTVKLSWSKELKGQPVEIQRSFDNKSWETIFSGRTAKDECSYTDNNLPVAAQGNKSYEKVYYRASLKYHDSWLWKDGSTFATQSIVPTFNHKYVTNVVATALDAADTVTIFIDNNINHVWTSNSEVILDRSADNGVSWYTIATYQKNIDYKNVPSAIGYKDLNLENCKVYQYRARIVPGNEDFSKQNFVLSSKVTPSNEAGFESITVSKGYYNNFVEIQWEIADSATFNEFEVKRRLESQKSESDWIIIENVARKDGSTQKAFRTTDQSCLPGVIYEYVVTGKSNCGEVGVIEKSTETACGFRSPTGAFTGRVTYGGGQSVDSVFVRATTNDNIESYAMSFNGKDSYLLIDDASLLQYTNPDMTLQAWVNASNGDGQIISKGKMFKLYLTKGKPCFEYGGNKVTASVSVTGGYNHVTAVADYKGKSMAIYINGELNVSAKITKSVNPVSDQIKIGSGLNGEIDEVRIWSKALSANTIQNDYMRYLAPGKEEDGLEAYYTFNFVSNTRFYDCSSSGNGIYNGRDGSVQNVGKTTNVPSNTQLSYMAITDIDGKYNIIGVPYLGNGTTYTIEPQKGTHVFNPNNEVRFINESGANHTINFTDESSFKVNGYVYYENTTHPAEGVGLYVDGTACTLDNNIVQTNSDGYFEISVPIGSHYISLGKPNHTFVKGGRYPEDPNNIGLKHAFVRDESNLVFYDNTYVVLAGRIAGGSEENSKKLGMKQSKANIGQAMITLELQNNYKINSTGSDRQFGKASEYVNSSAESKSNSNRIVIKTDPVTGEYAVKLPPVDFTVSEVKIINNKDNINLGNQGTWKPVMLSEKVGKTTTDTAVVDGKTATFEYNDNFSVTYYANSKFEVSQRNVAVKGAFGESEYNYKDEINNIDTVISLYGKTAEGEIEYAFGYPIFIQDKKYAFDFYAYEEYHNYDGDMVETDRLPLKDAIVTVDNGLSAHGVVIEPETEEYSVGDMVLNSNQLKLDSIGRCTYVFKAGFPNINNEHTLGLNISYEYNGQMYVTWENTGDWDGKGIVFGGVMMGNNFVTAGPDNVHFVLRDPPGSGSSASLEEGTTITTSSSYTQTSSSAGSSTLTTSLGIETEVAAGFGVMVIEKMSVTDELVLETDIEEAINNRNEITSTMTLTERVSTSGEMNYVGSAGDVFIGKSTNIVYGGQRTVGLTYNCDSNLYKVDLDENYAGNVVFGTEFKYTQNYIENVLIPNWRMLSIDMLKQRSINNLPEKIITKNGETRYKNLREYPVFYSLVPESDPDYGTDGNYIFLPPTDDSCNFSVSCIDSVKWYQSQATYWEGVLAENERQKVLAISSDKDYDEGKYQAAINKYNYVKEAYNSIKAGEHDLSYYLDNDTFNAPFTEKEYRMYAECKDTLPDVPCTLYYDLNKYGFKVANYSFDSGTSFEKTVEYGSSKASECELDYSMSIVLSNQLGFEVNGIGEQLEIGTTQSSGYASSSSSSVETTTAVGFELLEDGDDDAISVDVFMAPDGFGPIFYTRAGQTSCPYEGEQLTKYYEPGKHKLAEATMQIEKPSIFVENNAKNYVLTGIPAGDVANFTIALNNESEIHEDVWYQLMIEDGSNPYGAMVMVDGKALIGEPLEVLVPAGETVYKTLSVTQSRIDTLKYENIGVILASSCQYDGTDIFDVIADTIHVTVQYVPSCSDIALQIENPIVNSNFNDASDEGKLKVALKDYNVQFGTFKSVRLQYKGEGDANWKLIKEFDKSELDAKNGYTNYTVDMSRNFSDQKYQFRAVTVCKFGNEEICSESEVIEVVKDMSKPASLGAPSPINGILTNDNEIYVQFNEQIQSGKLHSDLLNSNIVVEGVLNGHDIAHATAISLAETKAYTEADIDLSERDFTFEMWLNYTKPGTLIEHGVGQNMFKAEITADNKLLLTMGNKSITSDNALLADYWIYLAIAYNHSSEIVNANYAYDDATVNLFSNKSLTSYSGNGPLVIGGDMDVKMHELTLWNEERNFVTSTSEMNTAKYPSTWNLTGYWPLDEGKGMVGADNARSRNLVLPANAWFLNNVNYAASFNADSSYLEIDAETIPVKDEQDFAVEFWFRAEGAGTLFSAGDSLLAAGFDDNKSMFLIADGKKSIITASDFADSNWHHFALNVLRNGTSAIYIDGNVVRQLVSGNIPALSADKITLGAMGQYSGNVVYGSFFKGQIDEFRIWNATMTASALRMNMYCRIHGNEPGLVAYYPFEHTYVDDFNQDVTEFSTVDYVTTARHAANPSVAILKAANVNVEASTLAPALKESRQLESVKFGYVASDSKIVINVTEEASRIEGCTLEFTLKDVVDVNGNICEPIHWTAFVNRNQLKWADNSKSIKKELYDEYEFSVNIVNQSGSTENWTMTNLPTWLHASKTSGTLAALSSETIKFTVEESTSIGKYEETVYLTGNNNIDEPFVVSLHVTGQKPEWNVNASDFEYAMSIVGTMSVNGKLSEDAEDILAAYANGKLVGVCSPKYYERYDAYYLMMTVYGDSVVGDKLTFKIFDASTGINYPVVTSSKDIIFRQGALEGTMSTPVSFNAADMREQQIALKAGWNWMSMNVVPDELSARTVFADLADDLKSVKGKNANDGYLVNVKHAISGTMGDISVQKMYKVNMSKASVLNLVGASVDVANTPISINNGWNWIGYLPQTSMDVNSALADLDAQDGDIIKSQTQFALYDGYEWVGSLEYLRPGSGYLYYSNIDSESAVSFNYPKTSVKGADNSKSGEEQYFKVDDAQFSSNMTMIVKVMDGVEQIDNVELGVFAGDVCRGTARAIDGLYYLMIAGNEQADALKFRVYYIDGDSIVDVDQNLKYADDAILGVDSPYILQVGDANEVVEPIMSGIAICSEPNKTQYEFGEELDLTGAAITVSYSNVDRIDTVAVTSGMVNGFDAHLAGTQVVTVSFSDYSASFKVTVNDLVKLLSISMLDTPDKLIYNYGDTLDVDGGRLQAVYSNLDIDTVAMDLNMVYGFDSTLPGVQNLVVAFQGVSTTMQVYVKDSIVEEAEPVLLFVNMLTLPNRTIYTVGEDMDVTGGSISAVYSDATVDTLEMLASMVYGYDKTLAGVQTLVVAFQSVSTTMQVVVNEMVEEPTLVCIKFVSMPNRTVYNIGDELDVTGGQLMAVYSNGVTDTIEMTTDMVRGFNNAVEGLQTLLVFYNDAYESYSVSVVNPLDIADNESYVKIYGNNRVIIVESSQVDDSDIKVFNIEGRMVMIQKSAGTRTEVSMERQGVYIVKFGDTVERVVLY